MNLIDISSDLLTAPVYPGDPEPRLHVLSRIANGDACNLSALYACLHTGTHADAPMHFIEGGKSISEVPLECFIGPCTVLEIGPGPVTGEQIDALVKPGCERVLFKSGGSAYFLESAGDELAMLGVRLIGTDAQSVGCPRQPGSSAPCALAGEYCGAGGPVSGRSGAGRLFFDRSAGENCGPGRSARACCAGIGLYFLGRRPVK